MKIVGTYSSDRVYQGIAAAFSQKYNFKFWFPDKPAFDMMEETTPDYVLLFGPEWQKPNKFSEVIKEYNFKNWINFHSYDSDKIYYNENSREKNIKRGANTLQYGGGQPQEKYAADFGLILSIYNDGVGLCLKQVQQLFPGNSLKIFSTGFHVPSPFYLGELPIEEVKHAIASFEILVDSLGEWLFEGWINNTYVKSPNFPESFNLEDKSFDHLINKEQYRQIKIKEIRSIIQTNKLTLADQVNEKFGNLS